MMKTLICLAVALVCLGSVSSKETQKFDVNSLSTACVFPNTLTLVSSGGSRKVDDKNCDSEFNKADWQKQPTITFPKAEFGKTYTLINVDPDPPAYEKGQYWLHWLVSNIKAEDFLAGDFSKAKTLTDYMGPKPPSGSGVHRYMFLAFEEKEKNQEVENPQGRARFSLSSWLENQQFSNPVAGVQFRTSY